MESRKKSVKKRVIVLAAALLAAVLAIGLLGYRVLEKNVLYPLKYIDEVGHWAEAYGVDPLLVYSVIKTESSFNPMAESSAGARGLMQMTEDTFDWIKGRIAADEPLEYDDLYQPGQAIRFGTYYLAISLQRYGGHVPTAAAAYHSGWGTVDRLLEEAENTDDGVALTVFPYRQMAHYVNKINKSYDKYRQLYG